MTNQNHGKDRRDVTRIHSYVNSSGVRSDPIPFAMKSKLVSQFKSSWYQNSEECKLKNPPIENMKILTLRTKT